MNGFSIAIAPTVTMLFGRPLRYSLETLRRSPAFAIAAIVVLTLGIAANTIIFTLVDELLLNPFPYRQPDKLVMIWEANPARGGIAATRAPVAWANFHTWQAQNHAFEAMEAYEIFLGYNLTGRAAPEHVTAARATPGFFTMIGVNAAQGRTFLAGDDTPNGNPTVLLTYSFARKQFGDINPVNQRLLLDGAPYTITGVLPKQFHLPAFFEGVSEYKPDIWLPLPAVSATDPPDLAKRRRLVVWGRLKPDVSLAQARDDMKAVASHRRQEDPELNQGYDINVFPLDIENTQPDFRNDLRVFSLAALVILLLACTTIAGLMLTRATNRRKSLGIMTALGASRWSVISPILGESIILATLSGLSALLLSYGGIHLITSLKPSDIHGPERLALNIHAFLFTACISALTLLIFGLVPAWLVTRGNLSDSLKLTQTSLLGGSLTRNILLCIQVAAALSLTIAATLLIRSFQHVLEIDPGFRTVHVLTAHLSLPPQHYRTADDRTRFCRQLLENLRSLAGIEAAALVDYLPLTAIRVTPFEIESRPTPQHNQAPYVDFANVTPGFFDAMGITLEKGRFFTEQDAEADPTNVAIINEALARQFWPGADPLGSHIRRLFPSRPPGPWQTVVGVVHDFRQFNPETPARSELLSPTKNLSDMTTVVRTATTNPLSVASSLQQAVWNLDHDQPLSDVQSLDEIVTSYNSQRRFNMLAVSAFAAFSIVLTIVAFYGLLSSLISSRIRDIGIRFALGASRSQVCFSVIRPALPAVIAGIALGLLFSYLGKQLITAVLYQVGPLDPPTYIMATGGLLVVLLLTSLAATLRAARVDPAIVLREE